MFDKSPSYKKRKEGGEKRGYSRGGMDPRYWKEFEGLGEKVTSQRSGSEVGSPRRYRRGSRSSSSSSSGSSSSSSSSRRKSDSRHGNRKRQHIHSNSPSRGSVRSQSYSREPDGPWFPPSHPSQNSQQPQQDLPPSGPFPMPNQFPQPHPPQVQGQYPGNFPGPNFGNNYRSFGNCEQPLPPNYYPPNFPSHSGPPPHNFPLGGPGPGPRGPPGNWEMFPDKMLPPPNILQGPGGDRLTDPMPMVELDKKAEEAAKKEAIQQELLQQKRTLSKQREDYVRRKFSLNRELRRLKGEKRDLHKEKSKENERILRENAKLKGEIKQNLKSVDNVIEMLTNVIGDRNRLPDIIKEIKQMEKDKEKKIEEKVKKADKKKSTKRSERNERSEQSERSKRSKSCEGRKRSSSLEVEVADKNVLYYDPGLHWCPDCNIFPKTVSDYLQHLHSPQHSENAKMKFEEFPWHNLDKEESPTHKKDLPTKRIPIRGVQFLVPATAWFCSMCKVWLGDAHCASKHVQSTHHSQHYSEFIAKNPHWEVDWMSERTRSYEKKSEAKQQAAETVSVATPSSTSVTLDSLSNHLLALIAKTQETPAPPPPIAKESSSSEDDDSPDRKSKKKKKPKKKKGKDEKCKERSTHTPDQIKLSYKSMTERRVDPIPVGDNFISEWMPRVEKREPVSLKKKSDLDSKPQKRLKSSSREVSADREKKPDLYDQYNDHDDAITFDRHLEKDPRIRRKYDDERSPKEKYANIRSKSPEKLNKFEKDDKNDDYKKKILEEKNQKDNNERDRLKNFKFSRIRTNIEKNKLKNKAEKTSDEDVGT